MTYLGKFFPDEFWKEFNEDGEMPSFDSIVKSVQDTVRSANEEKAAAQSASSSGPYRQFNQNNQRGPFSGIARPFGFNPDFAPFSVSADRISRLGPDFAARQGRLNARYVIYCAASGLFVQ